LTRDGILEAAARIFGEKGYHATSMHDIAESVHLQKASLYHHFNSKQEILIALIDHALDLINSRLEAVLALSCSPDEKLRQAMVSYLQLSRKSKLSVIIEPDLDPELKTGLLQGKFESFGFNY
jgi:AcrR family transcriptional regulator